MTHPDIANALLATTGDAIIATDREGLITFWNPGATPSPDLFAAVVDETPDDVQRVMSQSLAVLRKHREEDTLRGTDGKHSNQVLADLAVAGYWGLLVDRDFGGSAAELRHYLPFLTQAALIDQPLAGLAAVHGSIGAVNPLQSFGSASQKQKPRGVRSGVFLCPVRALQA